MGTFNEESSLVGFSSSAKGRTAARKEEKQKNDLLLKKSEGSCFSFKVSMSEVISEDMDDGIMYGMEPLM